MNLRTAISSMLLALLLGSVTTASAETAASVLEQSMSETLDLWREGHFEQLFERLSHRGKMSREQFADRMRETSIRPVCCFQKLQNFKVLNEKRTEATVYARVGLEGTPGSAASSTREFKLSHEAGSWKMQLNDISSLAGLSAKKGRHGSRTKKHYTTSPFH